MLAVMEQVPAAFAVNIPLLDTVATVVSEEFQVAELVRSCWLLSVKAPVAVICCVWPATRLALGAATWMDSSVTCGVVLVADPPPQPASDANDANSIPNKAVRI